MDLVLCGGGLQNALVAAALFAAPGMPERQPAPRTALLESAIIGGNHTWCCYASDLSPAMRRQVAPLVSRRWPGYEVRFPGYRRRIATPYLMLTSARLRQVVHGLLARRGALVWEHATVARLEPGRVVLEDGRRVAGHTVIDARGAGRHATDCGYQKFYGEEVTLDSPHGLQWPLIMDATVPQRDGFRFMYVLPLSRCRALIEDTSFSDHPHLDVEQRRRGIAAWLQRHDLRVRSVTRSERGVLPMPWRMPAPAEPDAGVVRGGYGGGWFHPGTGYSLPQAAELAALVATTPLAGLCTAAAAARHDLQQRARFCCRLNRLLFHAYPPALRRNIFERFFRLPEPTIRRFFAMRLSTADKVRLLGGRPPSGLSPRRWRHAHAATAAFTPPWR